LRRFHFQPGDGFAVRLLITSGRLLESGYMVLLRSLPIKVFIYGLTEGFRAFALASDEQPHVANRSAKW
jgi:hypothetical protein